MMRFFLIILAVLILISMAGYAISLLMKLNRQQKQLKQAKNARYINILESIDVIARAMLVEQCDFSEGVLRIKPLLDVLGKKLSQFPAMWELYQVVESMPILEERKTLKRNERMKLDLEREAKEAELAEQIKTELQQLLAEMEQFKQELK
ncbi:DUF2489 domain-containing protein [Ursidibacter maritimus]|uniref:DUF2489 domain-containing protein n=1 Tax=Ursidibacter maritimus TaxID=1331689 RepID=A0A949WR03_9PAST|nr:DUF2489 domain-containing protein [Ursidibacter maritimus]KAE9539117.1 coproporphyrinogen III oxidase [Ursidibacter maritimus]MBV6524086.1 DUF2489 domain-containing protein [Ursidibacter maritimus]MBV6526409.1 DUF2489 domain-containing protein [Ursidibacter maritimus]MBV6527033.1 DUF2489 domain-containing protein [Ursidibacter maritimus]MBV6528806.1 DUF2489 domain-containing protein [Ursidibacter maritimus]